VIGLALLGVPMKRQFVASVIVGLAMLMGVALLAASSGTAQSDHDGQLCPICRILFGH
jgi:hypothetical protein